MSKIDINFNENDNIKLKFKDSGVTVPIDYGGKKVVVDSELSTTSRNPVENRVVTNALNQKADTSALSNVAFSGNYDDLYNKPIHQKSKAEWDSNPNLISKLNNIYVYLDYYHQEDKDLPAIKVGDGTSYLIDLPVIGGLSVTEAEKIFWNNKVTCFLATVDNENIVFSKD